MIYFLEYRRSHQIHTPGVTNEDLWIIVGQCISVIGILIALLLLVTGVRVLIGPCQLTPHVTDSGTLKSAIKVCGLWCTLEFLRAILLLLGLSLRLLVFALLAADELTNMEIAKQSTVLIPLTTSLTSMSATSKFRDEVENHLCREINHMHPIPQFALPSTSGGGG